MDVHEVSTVHHPIKYRCILPQGYSRAEEHQRIAFTPEIKGVSTAQHMSHSVIRWSSSLAVVGGVSRRPIALRCAALVLLPITKSSLKRWIDDMGAHVPPPEALLQPLLTLTPVTAHRDD